ncbi:MAG: HYR domain-containing protein [Flavobacteriales bacterium]|nr:HYR domain-containing protein [Flavobacteriales bacterium]
MKYGYWLKKALFTLAFMCTLGPVVHAQLPDSKGKDFWLAFPRNIYAGNTTLFISSGVATSGTVSVAGIGFSQNFNVTPGVTTTINIPTSVEVQTANGIENKGIHVVANDEVTVYGLNQASATTDAYMGLPTDILGTDYLVNSYIGLSNGAYPSQLSVVGTQDGTTITVTPKVTAGGHAAGVPYNVVINQGQVYQLGATGGGDLTGSRVTSTAPVAVYGSVVCANVPTNCFACDHLIEQIPPISSWGKSFVSAPLATRTGGDIFRFLASENSTSVTVNGANVATLNAGDYHEMLINGNAVIAANKPILVTQYSRGSSCDGVTSDPFMMIIPPFEQFLGEYTVGTPSTGFSGHYINLVVPQAAIGDVKLDGTVVSAGSFSVIGASGFWAARLPISAGTHTVSSNYPVGVHTYGFGSYDSYGYPGGQSLAPIGFISTLTLAPVNGGTSQIGTQHCVVGTVLDQYSNPVSGVRVDFAISGAHSLSGFAFTDANGDATYCYNGAYPGSDVIVATTGALTSNQANKSWTCADFSFTYTSAVCDSSNTSSITFTGVQGGVAPYSYSIDGGSNYSTSASFTGIGLGSYNLIVKDAAGCTSNAQNTTLADTQLPQAVCQNIVVQLDGNHEASISAAQVDGGSTDNCGIANLSIDIVSFNCNNLGDNNVTLTVTDVNGNQSTCVAVVTVRDDNNPCCAGPAAVCQNITVYLDASGQASITAGDVDGGSTADCGLQSMTVTPSAFDCSQAGTTVPVILTVTDINNVSATCTANVTVNDSVSPVAATQDITVYLDAAGNAAIVAADLDNGSSDACGIASLSISNSTFNCANVGANTIVLTATDNNGNQSSNTSTVTVIDSTAPVVIPQNITVYLDAAGNAAITAADVDGGSSDACGLSLSINNSTFNCGNVGANTVVLTGTDNNGNQSSNTSTVTVVDSTAPAISCPADIYVVSTPTDCDPAVTWDAPQASDNCSFTVSGSHNSGDEFGLGTTTVAYTVTDASGNTASCSFNVTVTAQTLEASVSSPEHNGYNVSCNGGNDGEATATVNGGCLPYSYLWSDGQAAATAAGLSAGAHSVTVSDNSGQVVVQSITLTEPSQLVADAGNPATVYRGYTPSSCATLNGSASGSVPGYSYLWSTGETTADINVCPTATTIYTLTVTDANGCTAVDSVTVCVIDVRCEKGGKAIIMYEGGKVMVCHVNGNGTYNTLCISPNAVADHLAHGDALGYCDDVSSCDYINEKQTNMNIWQGLEAGADVVAFPNPFSQSTTIRFNVHSNDHVQIAVYNMNGQQIEVLFNQDVQGGFVYQATFDGQQLPEGMYFYQMTSENGINMNGKLILNR